MTSSGGPPGILRLPHEFLFMIFEYMDSLSDLVALIRTSATFNTIWKTRTASISTIVLTWNIECYSEALSLEEKLCPEPAAGFEAAVRRHERIIKAASCVDNAWKLFCSNYVRVTNEHRLYYRARFKKMFYWTWKIVGASIYRPFKLPKELRDELALLQFQQLYILPLCELTVWIAGTYNSGIKKNFAAMHKIYPSRDRVRFAYHDRWTTCCEQLWQFNDFQKCHQDHFALSLQTNPLLPSFYSVRNDAFLQESRWKSCEVRSRYWHLYPGGSDC